MWPPRMASDHLHSLLKHVFATVQRAGGEATCYLSLGSRDYLVLILFNKCSERL